MNATAHEVEQTDLAQTALVRTDINRRDIEASNFDVIFGAIESLGVLAPDAADLDTLRKLQSKIGIFVDGYNDDPRELFEVPEVCQYFQTLHKAWPFGLYFFSHTVGTLQLLVWCNAGARVAGRGSSKTVVGVSEVSVHHFVENSWAPTLAIAGRLHWPPQKASAFKVAITKLCLVGGSRTQSPDSDAERRQRHQNFVRSQALLLAEIAQNGFQEEGRGCVMILPPEGGTEGSRALFINQAELQQGGEELAQVVKLVERYEPNTQFVVSICEADVSQSSSYTVKIPW